MRWTVLLLASSACAQMSSLTRPVQTAVTQFRPVQTAGGTFVVPQSGSGPAYGITLQSGQPGDNVQVGTYGELLCEFDAAPMVGLTAVALNGYCHSDASIINDSDVPANKSAIGRVMQLVPERGANFATVNFRFPAARGSKITSDLITDFDAAVKSHQTVSGGAQGQSAYQVAQANGFTGTQAQWLASLVGPSGPAGVAGVAGPAGNVGATGSVGPKGDRGDIGPVGPSGPAGSSGAIGPTGPAGVAGNPGVAGVAGPKGDTGIQGVAGTAATVTVGTVTKLACNATPTVVNVGTTSAAVLNFGIPTCNPMSATSTAIGGTLLAVGQTVTQVVPITGAIVGNNCSATATDGSLPTGGMVVDCAVTAAGQATLLVRALVAVTPPLKQYLLTVLP